MGTRRNISYAKGPKGKCEIRLLEGDDGMIIRLVNEAGISRDFEEKNCYSPLPSDAAPRKKYPDLFYKLNAEETAIYQLNPLGTDEDDEFFVRYSRMPSREDDVPQHFASPGREIVYRDKQSGKTKRFWKAEEELFNVILTIVSGRYKGMELKATLNYFFEEDVDGSMMMDGVGKAATKLDRFLTEAGFDWGDDSIEYSANILPELDAILQDRASSHMFRVVVRNGYVQEFKGIPDGMKVEE